MPSLLLNLRHVPDDEIDELAELLDRHAIGWYRTPASPWGISAGGLWLTDSADAARARALMAEYQAQRQRLAREAQAQARQEGRHETVWTTLRTRPLQGVLVLLGIVVVLALSMLPIALLWR